MTPPPIPHEMRAAGPAKVEAVSAPNSHPDPMMDPTDVKRSPTNPTSRRSRRRLCVGALTPVVTPTSVATLALSMRTPLHALSLLCPHFDYPRSPKKIEALCQKAAMLPREDGS